MGTFEIIKIILSVVAGAISVGVPSIINLIKAIKNFKNAKTQIDKEQAYRDMKDQMKVLIQAAEIAYKNVNEIMKEKGSSAGLVKKDSVMMKLQSYAVEKGYSFDSELWSNEIDKEVEFTRNVNSKE